MAAAGQPRWPLTHPAREDRCHLEDGPAISPSALQLIGCNATISTMVHDADGTILAAGDITTTSHDADITYHTIIPPHSGERLNLHEAIWVSFVQAEASAARRGQLQQAC